MQSAPRTILYFLAALSFFFGLNDIVSQYAAGEALQWRYPIILIGFGVGLPTVLFFSPDLFSVENGLSGEGEGNSGDGDGDGGD